MIEGIWNWFGNTALPWFRDLFGSILAKVWGFIVGWFQFIIFIYFIIWVARKYMMWAVPKLVDSIKNLHLPADSYSVTADMLRYGAFINHFIPLTEALAMAVILFNIWSVVTLFRWIKSLVPTISN